MSENYVQCELCPRKCMLAPGERGNCRARINYKGALVTLVYGKPCAVHKDPIEKKPMFHFLPGSFAFSIATAGCNLHCKFCQNWEISQANPEDTINDDLPPEKVVMYAKGTGCASIAYTYSEPIIFYEYSYDTSKLAHEAGINNILVTAGFIKEKPLRKLCKVTDGANIDLKGFSEDFYRRVCSGQLEPILNAIKISKEEGLIVELTNLIIPSLNDDYDMIKRMCNWILKELGPEVPLHFSRFFPRYQLKALPPTPLETLVKARELAISEGIYFVYIGNIEVESAENTYCPSCKKPLIERMGYFVLSNRITEGKCPYCQTKIYGKWS